MKRGKLETEDEAQAVRVWLEKWGTYDISHRCPWHFYARWRFCDADLFEKCQRLFPRLESECPCHEFGLPYVFRKAKIFVQEWEEAHT